MSICWRWTPGSPETACRHKSMTGLAGERKPWDGGGGGGSTDVDLVIVVLICHLSRCPFCALYQRSGCPLCSLLSFVLASQRLFLPFVLTFTCFLYCRLNGLIVFSIICPRVVCSLYYLSSSPLSILVSFNWSLLHMNRKLECTKQTCKHTNQTNKQKEKRSGKKLGS